MILDFIKTDKNNLYYSIYKGILSATTDGIIKKGEKLPSVREAALQLGVSRTTVENAYEKLCIEGIAESRPQRGYYIVSSVKHNQLNTMQITEEKPNIKYDFSSRKIDNSAADTENWKKLIRSVLRESEVLTSYGNPQGEYELRVALSTYTYKARGVIAKPENIVIGAGIGPLLNILCGILGRDITVGMENGGFKEAESIFSDYGINTITIKSDSNGAIIDELNKSGANVLFLIASALGKISVTGISNRRTEFINWSNENENRYIIEDDYNGELRYTARSVPAFQGKLVDKCIYIGSFSKLLLPSVRIAYMVLPDNLSDIFRSKMNYYNQTCGKTEQLALTEYISNGNLEKQLRKLRRLYYFKSKILLEKLREYPYMFKKIYLSESSLSVKIKTALTDDSLLICKECEKQGIKVMAMQEKGVY